VLRIGDADLTHWLGAFFWPFLRTLALFAVAPGFGSSAIPGRIKVALAFVIALLLAGTVRSTVPLTLSPEAAVLVFEQIAVGLAIGFAMQLALGAAAFAGDLVGVQMGFGFAGLLDVQTRFEVPVIADFFGLLALLLFLVLDGHLLLLGVLAKSFEVVPIAAGPGIAAEGWHVLVGAAAALFQMGLWLALPVVAVLLAAHAAMALLSRVAPQINLMSVGFSVFMWVGIAATIAVIPFFTPAVARMIETGLRAAHAALAMRP
jgi:flagellar biosynthesis protein FliR